MQKFSRMQLRGHSEVLMFNDDELEEKWFMKDTKRLENDTS